MASAGAGPGNPLGVFTAGRIITGVGTGLNTSTIPMWQSELSKAHNRGLLVLVEGALIAGGIMIAVSLLSTYSNGLADILNHSTGSTTASIGLTRHLFNGDSLLPFNAPLL